MKKKSLLATGLVLSMALTMTTPAFAANKDANVNVDGTEVTAPGSPEYDTAGSGKTQTAGQSFNEATITGENSGDLQTVNDDDARAGADDLDGADINVWAKVSDSGSKIYKVDLAWGAMKFEYNSGSGKWDTESHTYAGGSGAAAWTDTFIDGTNNKISITNHSNNAIDAGFRYAMDGKPFNDAPTGDNAVLGNFFDDNAKSLTASKVLTGTYAANVVKDDAVADKLAGSKVALPTADAYNSSVVEPTDNTNNVTAGERKDDVFFAFSGTPDKGRGATLDSFKKVGVITVTVTPNKDVPLNRPIWVAQP